MRKPPDFRIGRNGIKNTEFLVNTNTKEDLRAERDLQEADLLTEMAETAAEKGDVEGGLRLLDRAAKLRNRS